MTSVLRAFALGVAFLLTNLLYAQTETVDLAVIAEINVTLDNDCQAAIIPEQVLSGDFDVDGNGVIPLDAFTIVVQDADPSNGPIIDNCGTHQVVITAAGITGFTTGWATIMAEDKTSPEILEIPTAPDGPLYCEDVDVIDIGLLPNDISRCYSVNTFTGTIVPGSLHPQLLAKLVAGGGLPTATDNCSELIQICVNDIVTRDAENPQCNDVVLTRSFTVTDGSCESAAGETNAPAAASYEITFTRPTLDDLDISNIPEVVIIECGELEGLGLAFGDLPDPRPQDLPFFDGPNGTTIPLRLGEGGSFCNIGLSYEDSPEIVTCDLAYKVIRTYTVIDWCNTSDIRTLTQIIKIGDFTAPSFTPPTQDIDFNGQVDVGPLQFLTNAGNECGAYIRLDDATISLTDACSNDLTLRAAIFPNGNTDGPSIGSFPINLNDFTAEVSTLIPVGSHILRYTYSDECGNTDFTDVDFVVSDGTAPVAICEDGLNVSLTAGFGQGGNGSQGIAVLTPDMVDKASYDDCGDVSLEIGRVRQNADGTYQLVNGASYGDRIELSCDDLGEVLVGLKVTDAGGNENYCWLSVLVEDKVAPTCTPPTSITLTCVEFEAAGLPAIIEEADDDLLNATFGSAFGEDNCAVVVSQSVSGDVDNCGVGVINRTFTATDGQGFTNVQPCRQRITVTGIHDYIISFPGDAEAFCMVTPDVGDVEVIETGCDLITKDIEVDTFASDSDECYKIRLAHRVINWCEYNTIGQPYIVLRDYDGDNDKLERTFLHVFPAAISPIAGEDAAILDNDAIRFNTGFTWPVDDGDDLDGTDDNNGADNNDTDAYATDNSRGAFLYYQFVRVYDEIAPQIIENNLEECFPALSANCTGSVELTFELVDECTAPDQVDSRVELDQDYSVAAGFSRTRFLLPGELSDNGDGDFKVSLENVPVGDHAIRIRGADGCGNVDIKIIEFCVIDEKAPTPICIGQLTATLMPNGDGTGMAAIWASDFIASDVEDCSGEVTYSIYTEAVAISDNFSPEPGRDGIILDCDSEASLIVRVYAFDPLGQGDYCSVIVLVQGADNVCAGANRGSIAGTIMSENGSPIDQVNVSLSGPESDATQVSIDDGTFYFPDLKQGDDFTIDVLRTDYINHSQGVSTFDLVLITRHILGLQEIISPYDRLAADANGDKDISVQDIIAIRRLILGLDDEYQNNSAYRFVDASFIFPVSSNPWATNFPEVVNVNNLAGNITEADFIGLMVGDVDGNGVDNLVGGNGTNGRPRGGVKQFFTEDQILAAGNTYIIELTAAETAGLVGLQGTFQLSSAATITGVAEANTQFAAGNLNPELLSRGLLPFSFNTANGLSAETPILRLELLAREDARLSNILTISDKEVFAEGYTNSGATVNLGISFGNTSTAAIIPEGDVLGQNLPNPVTESTIVPFQLQKAGEANLVIRDLNGRLLLQRNMDGVAGTNRFILARSELGPAGVITYTLSAGDFTATRKMIIK